MTSRQTAAPAAKALVASKMPEYKGRSADRLADIKNDYEREPEIGDMNAGMGRRDAGKQAARVVSAEPVASPTITARADRNPYERDKGPVPNAMGVPDTEVYKRSEMDDFGREGRRVPTRPGQATSGTPTVTKEELAASGMSLRDYLNKQQGLTRREEPKATAGAKTTAKQDTPSYSNEGRNKPVISKDATSSSKDATSSSKKQIDLRSPVTAARSLYDRFADTDKQDTSSSKKKINLRSPVTAARSLAEILGSTNKAKGGSVKNMASGGSVSSASSRADGIAQRGKTKCKMR
jgi:hypothetical protein